jgi:hypothetical protein
MKIFAAIGLVGAVLLACAGADVSRAGSRPTDTACVLLGITISPTNAVVHVGDTLRVRAAFDDCPGPSRVHSYRWTTTNASVATVDSLGLVRAQARGVVTIVAALVDAPDIEGAMVLNVDPPPP